MSQYTPGPPAPDPYNPYQAPEVDASIVSQAPTEDPAVVPDHIVEHLRGTRPWVIFLAVVCFLGAGLMGLVCFVFLGTMAVASTKVPGMSGAIAAFAGILYLSMAVACAVPGIYMIRYTSAIGRLLRDPRMAELGVALDAQRVYWKAVGILCIALIVLYPIGFMIFAVALAATKGGGL